MFLTVSNDVRKKTENDLFLTYLNFFVGIDHLISKILYLDNLYFFILVIYVTGNIGMIIMEI